MANCSRSSLSEKQAAYRHFAKQAPDLPIFVKPFYLDAVCGAAQWSAALVERNGRWVGALPFFLKQKLGQQYVAMPQLCRFMGPYLLPEYRTGRKAIPLLRALIEQLPPIVAFEQDFHYCADNWLPFYWAGFRQTTRYSYVLPLANTNTLWSNIAPTYRNRLLPRALERLEVVTRSDLRGFLQVHDGSFKRQGLKAPFSLAGLERLDQALAAEGCRQIFWAVDRNTGTPHSVLYLIWDEQSAYLLLHGDEPTLRASGSGILILWEAIRYSAETLRVPTFDFLGSMLPNVEPVRRRLGAEPKPYFRVAKEWSLAWRVGKWLRRICSRV